MILDFIAPRVRSKEYEDFQPRLDYIVDAGGGRWQSSILIPRSIWPHGLKAINAFAIVRDNYICHSPLPGPEADFHQPDRFPSVTIRTS